MASSISAGVATDALFLAIDPYPRKPDAVFEPLIVAEDPEDHPFAALKALQVDAKPRVPRAVPRAVPTAVRRSPRDR